MRIDLTAQIFAPTTQAATKPGEQAASAGEFMTLLNEMQGDKAQAQASVLMFEAAAADTGDASWVPWTEEELSRLADLGVVADWEIDRIREHTFPEAAADRWMQIIAPFLHEATLPDAKLEYLRAGRQKCPFLDWVMSGKDPVDFFRQPGTLTPPLHQRLDAMTTPLITTAAPPATPGNAVPRDSAAKGGGSAASLLSLEPAAVPEFLEPQIQRPRAMVAPDSAGSGTFSESAPGQSVTQDFKPGDQPAHASELRPAVAAVRPAETGVPGAARNADGPAAATPLPTAAAVASVLREAAEAPHRQQGPAANAEFGPSIAPAPAHVAHAVSRPSQVEATAAPQAEFLTELAERIQVQVRQGGNDIRIQLRPANLGHVDISAHTGAEGVIARIVTESTAVKHYLQSNLHVLEQALVDQGLRMDRIEVVTQSYLDARQSSAQPDSQYAGSGYRDDQAAADSGTAAPVSAPQDGTAESALRAIIGPNSTFHTVA